jgi:hypothetical protein
MQLAMYHSGAGTVRADALFVSVLQRSDELLEHGQDSLLTDPRLWNWRGDEAHPHRQAEVPA